MEISFSPYKLQYLALEKLLDNETSQILMGGAMASGKSLLAAAWITMECLRYSEDITIGVFRNRLIDLKNSFLRSLFEVFNMFKLKEGIDYTFNRQLNYITFKRNNSTIIFGELQNTPSDPDYNRVRGLNLTHAVIDEASQLTSKTAYSAVSTRVRYKHKKLGITGKILLLSNPCSGFIKDDFYTPFKNGTLSKDKACILGLPTDNKSNTDEYLKMQRDILSPVAYKILMEGDWNVNDDELGVFHYDDIMNNFDNDLVDIKETYLSIDVAGGGNDYSVFVIWQGLKIIDIIKIKLKTTPEHLTKITELKRKYNIQKNSNIVIDATGIGNGLATSLSGCYKYMGASKPISGNYVNIRNQCILTCAEYVKEAKMSFPIEHKNDILKEFLNINYDKIDSALVQVDTKEKMKKRLGSKSPDTFDAICMRMVFSLKKSTKVTLR